METSKAERDVWIDLAKAVCILLVVLFHARHYARLVPWTYSETAADFWWFTASILRPLRMPLFFLVSGVLAAPSLTRPGSAVLHKRVYNLFYIYSLWGILYLLFIPAWPVLGSNGLSVAQNLFRYVAGIAGPWYLWALAVFFLGV